MPTTLTPVLLQQLMQCPQARADECFPAMIDAMARFDITTPARITCFYTQVKWESGGLQWFAEIASGDAYNGRSDLGNTQPGDGPRYKGSGPIQVTGRDNFTQAQHALDAAGINIDIVANPDLARTVQYGFWISCWWWSAHGGNQVAERSPLDYASLCCGRLVNRGNANSGSPAQDEGQRVQAFNHISSFGALSLPGATPAPPPPPKGFTMDADATAAFAALNKRIDTLSGRISDQAADTAAIKSQVGSLEDWVMGPDDTKGVRDPSRAMGNRVKSILDIVTRLPGAPKS